MQRKSRHLISTATINVRLGNKHAVCKVTEHLSVYTFKAWSMAGSGIMLAICRMKSSACTRSAVRLVLKMARLCRMNFLCRRWKLPSQAMAGLSLLRVNICMPGEVACPAHKYSFAITIRSHVATVSGHTTNLTGYVCRTELTEEVQRVAQERSQQRLHFVPSAHRWQSTIRPYGYSIKLACSTSRHHLMTIYDAQQL